MSLLSLLSLCLATVFKAWEFQIAGLRLLMEGISVYIHLRTRIHIHTYMCVYMYIHTYIHEYTHVCVCISMELWEKQSAQPETHGCASTSESVYVYEPDLRKTTFILYESVSVRNKIKNPN